MRRRLSVALLLVSWPMMHADPTQLEAEDASPTKTALDATKCLELGFTEALLCATCDRVKDIVGDDALTNECLACCTTPPEATASGSAARYQFARLVLDRRMQSAFESVNAFVNDHAVDFEQLEVDHGPGALPQLLLYESEDDVEGPYSERIRIDKWPTDVIVEYLKENLRAP
eukprot:TRINITY_DN27597_c0_g1_i1.p1 TRINITY_DN27597_c0_g1~~TRINITY_DN27597_c0_g1_i1.p1  ORF type:complete len:198 (-),score=34.44 TRINITY_DN27597_c0_g1_i1:380-898(-)